MGAYVYVIFSTIAQGRPYTKPTTEFQNLSRIFFPDIRHETPEEVRRVGEDENRDRSLEYSCEHSGDLVSYQRILLQEEAVQPEAEAAMVVA